MRDKSLVYFPISNYRPTPQLPTNKLQDYLDTYKRIISAIRLDYKYKLITSKTLDMIDGYHLYKICLLKHYQIPIDQSLNIEYQWLQEQKSKVIRLLSKPNNSILSTNNDVDHRLNLVLFKLSQLYNNISLQLLLTSLINCLTSSDNPTNNYSLDESIQLVKVYLIESPLFSIVKSFKNSRVVYNININSDDIIEVKTQSSLPMLCPPSPWIIDINSTNASYGGYLSNRHGIFKLVSGGSKHGRELTINSRLVNLINLLQCQPIPINNNIVNNLINVFNEHKDNLLKDISVISEDLLLLNNKSPSFKHKSLIKSLLNNTLQESYWKLKLYHTFGIVINQYEIYKIYQVISVDFRGRLYALSSISHTNNKTMRHIDGCIEMDATANIIQLLAIMTINDEMLLNANLYSGNSTDPWKVFYDWDCKYESDEIISILKLFWNETGNNEFELEGLDLSLISRVVVKYSVMEYLYGSNAFSIALKFRNVRNINISYKHVIIIIACFYNKYSFEYNIITNIKYINKLHVKKYNTGLRFSNGFIEFNNTYMKEIKHRINLKDTKGYKNIKSTWTSYINSNDLRKSNNACCANLFHNLDSGVVLTILETFLNNNKFILTIHDAFIISEIDRYYLIKCFNKYMFDNNSTVLIDLFSNNLHLCKGTKLKEITNIIETLKVRLVNIDISKVYKSKYSLKEEKYE